MSDNSRGRRAARVFFLAVFSMAAGGASATPFIPRDDAQILEQLPARSGFLPTLRSRSIQNPRDLAAALAFARANIAQGRLDADMRFLGHAQAALAPWWDLPRPPVDVLVLRAVIRQSLHDFDGALADITRALRRRPMDAQAWLTRASIHQVQADYASAARDCALLARLAAPLVAQACLTQAQSLTGHAPAAYAALARASAQAANPGEVQWVEGLLAEMAQRLGKARAADAHFKRALKAAPPDAYLLASYSDFLLDRGRAREVVALLNDRTAADPLLLRLALAEQRLGAPTLNAHVELLRARFAALHERGDRTYMREEARFVLAFERDPARALKLARASFRLQREPADARVLFEAALAVGDARPARPALDWLRDNRVQDVTLDALARRLEARA